MPWIPKKDALRRIREQRGFTIYMLAARVGMSERQIRKIESDNPPGAIFGSNLYALADVLGCTKEELADWTARRPRRETSTEPPANTKKRSSAANPKTLWELAEFERRMRLAEHLETPPVETPAGTFPPLTAELYAECHTQFAVYDGQRFLVVGRIEQHKPLTYASAKALDTEAGVGGRFELGRDIAYGVPFFVTVFVKTADETRRLLHLVRDDRTAAVVVRVLAQPPKGHWKGFPSLREAEPVPFALVVDTVLERDVDW